MLERGVFSQTELDEMLSGDDNHIRDSSYTKGEPEAISPAFKEGDYVRIKSESTRLLWRRPHLRCPGYIYNAIGKIIKYNGIFDDPFYLAFRGKGPKQPLYSIAFPSKTIWTSASPSPATDKKGEEREEQLTEEDFNDDCITAEIYQIWMEPYKIGHSSSSSSCSHSHSHKHYHHPDGKEGAFSEEHDHNHREEVGGGGVDSSLLLSPSDPHYQHLQHHDLTTSYDSFDEKIDHTGNMRMIRSNDENDLNSSTFSVNSTGTGTGGRSFHDQSTFSLAVNVSHSQEDGEDEAETDHKAHEEKESHHSLNSHHHNHDHSSVGGGHQDRETVERNAHEKEGIADSPGKIISQALLKLLYLKGIFTAEQMTQMIEKLENGRTSLRGAELVARAWKDEKFKEKLLFDGWIPCFFFSFLFYSLSLSPSLFFLLWFRFCCSW
jgi:hypothetical protein